MHVVMQLTVEKSDPQTLAVRLEGPVAFVVAALMGGVPPDVARTFYDKLTPEVRADVLRLIDARIETVVAMEFDN